MAVREYEAKVNLGDWVTGIHEKTRQSLKWLKEHYSERIPGVQFELVKGTTWRITLDGQEVGTIKPVE